MIYKFDTEDRTHAELALLLYAMYKSREATSPLNGMDTWKRFGTFVAGACEESENIREFLHAFCKKAIIQSIIPRHFHSGEPYELPSGELIQINQLYDLKMEMFSKEDMLSLLRKEGQYIILLVRARCEREKIEGNFGYENNL